MTNNPDTPRARGDHDAPHMTPATPGDDFRTVLINRVSWGAVLAGVVMSLVAQLILNMIGVGVGLNALDPAGGDNPSAETFSMGAGIWWAVSGVIASGLGGFSAGRLSGQPKESTAAWHGLTAWAVATLVVVYLLTSALGNLMGGALNTVSRAAPAVSEAASSGPLQEQLRAAGLDPDRLGEAAGDAARSASTDRERAAEAADTAADAASTAALVSALALLLGAAAAWFGGRAGRVQPTITAETLAADRDRLRV